MLEHAAFRLPRPRAIAAAGLVAALALLGLGSPAAPRAAALHASIGAKRAAAQALRAGVAADSARARAATGGLLSTQARLTIIQREVDLRTAQLAGVQSALLRERARLTRLENRLAQAESALVANLRQSYENTPPDALSVVFEAHGFADLLERLQFLKRARDEDARVVRNVRAVQAIVMREATRLGALEARDRSLAAVVIARRNQVAALRETLVRERIGALNGLAHKAAQLHQLQRQLAALQARRAAQQASVAAAPGNVQVNTGGMVQPPSGAPAAVARVMAAGNAIATLPYRYGGGHGSFHDNAYDCSGSVSYALAAAGLVTAPLASGEFETWGAPGPGRWITVYANAGHAFMYVAGWRFDTVALGGGTRWSQSQTSTAGFVARHPPGL